MAGQDGNVANGSEPEVVDVNTTTDGSQGSTPPEGNANVGENGIGSPTPAWMGQLPDDLKQDEELSKFATLGDLAKFVKEASKETQNQEDGSGEEAGTEEPTEYSFEDTIGENFDPFGKTSESLKSYFAKNKVPEEVAQGAYKALNEAMQASTEKLVTEGGKYLDDVLKKQWGDDFDKKRTAMSRSYNAFIASNAQLEQGLQQTGATVNPYIAEVLARVGEHISEDGGVVSTLSGASSKRDYNGSPIDYSKNSK